ncbi:unnamed protein product [Schistocephalus solidus]|uniref:Uncharacterized protein n=1 Tax=Schistocephalus solidus TaxID=70667 RepID=A0A183SHT1_SCHSO|nr:unnamed protein product [Schistocephalus solidus]
MVNRPTVQSPALLPPATILCAETLPGQENQARMEGAITSNSSGREPYGRVMATPTSNMDEVAAMNDSDAD